MIGLSPRSHSTCRLVAPFLILLASLTAQVRSGRISGLVSDTTGAVIPGAAVTVLEIATNQRHEVTSNDAGEFNVPYLAAGLYEVRVEKLGFESALQKQIELGVAQTVRVEMQMKLGNVQTTVEISGSSSTIQTESAAVQGVTTEKAIESLSNVNHNPLYYATLQLGVTPRAAQTQVTGQNSFGIGINGRRQASAVAINGGGAFQNDIQVDGVGVVGSAWNEAAVTPTTEGLHRFGRRSGCLHSVRGDPARASTQPHRPRALRDRRCAHPLQ